MSCALPCTWWCCTIEPVWAPPRKLRTKSLSYVCSGLFCKPNPCFFCFVLTCGIRVASKSNVESIPFPKQCSHISMWMIILLDHRGRMLIFFSKRRASLQVDPIISTFARSILSSLQRCLLHPTQVAFVFPPSHPFSSRTQISQPCILYWWEVSSFFSFNVLTRWFSWRCSSSLSLFVLFLLQWTKFKLSVLIIFPSSFQVFLYVGSSLNHSPFAIQLFRSAKVIPEDSGFYSKSFQAISRSYLIQAI